MKVSAVLLCATFMAAATAAQAQVVVSIGAGLAHDCFVHAKTGLDLAKGVEACTQSLQHDPLQKRDRAGTYDNRGVLLDMLGRTDQAAADFNTAIALDPSLGDPYVNLGAMLIKKGQYQEALVQVNKGMDLGMSFPHIGYYNRAVAEQMLGRYKESYYDYKKVLELEPRFEMASERLKDFTVIRNPARSPS